jgi:hypothetical protein
MLRACRLGADLSPLHSRQLPMLLGFALAIASRGASSGLERQRGLSKLGYSREGKSVDCMLHALLFRTAERAF